VLAAEEEKEALVSRDAFTKRTPKEFPLKVFVTGAAGFIGSTLVERLLSDGHEVIGLDNFDDFYDPAIKRRNIITASQSSAYTLIEGDFRDKELIDSLFRERRPEGVIHLGARAGVRPSLTKAPLYVDVNLVGTTNLLDASRDHGIGRFVFASSSSVYGARPLEPFKETDEVEKPVSPYAATKRSGELICHTYHHLFDLPISCLRFFTVYGPRQRPEMAIHLFTSKIANGEAIDVFGDGSAQRDFTFIDDIVDGIVASFERASGFKIYNLGRGDTNVLSDVIDKIQESLGVEAKINYLPVEPGDVPTTFADTTLTRAELDYEPKVLISEGIPRFVEWFRAQEADLAAVSGEKDSTRS